VPRQTGRHGVGLSTLTGRTTPNKSTDRRKPIALVHMDSWHRYVFARTSSRTRASQSSSPAERRPLLQVNWHRRPTSDRSNSAFASRDEVFGASVSSSASHEQDEQDDQEDGTQPAADVRAAKVEAAAAEQNDQDDQKDNKVHDILSVFAECEA
jgi:hypothetical protein